MYVGSMPAGKACAAQDDSRCAFGWYPFDGAVILFYDVVQNLQFAHRDWHGAQALNASISTLLTPLFHRTAPPCRGMLATFK